MATVLMRLRTDVRTRWRGMLGLALLLGLVGGVVLTAAAGARRTDSAYPRLLAWANAAEVTVIVTDPGTKPPAGQPQDKYFVAGGRAAEQVRRRYFAALAALPQVASEARATEYNMALPVPGGQPDPGVQVFSSPDDSLGVTGDRVKITAGRMFGPAASGLAVIDPALASREHLRPGSVLHLIGIPKDANGSADLKLAVPLSFRVAAVGVFDDQVVAATTTTTQPRVLLSPPFAATDGAVAMTNLPEAAVRLRAGASMASFLHDADQLRRRYGIGTNNYTTVSLDGQVTATQRAIRPQALALAVFAALVALVGMAVTGQLLARQLALDAADFPVLRAIGQTRQGLAAEALIRLALVTVAGGVIAVAVAVAASPLLPIGPARLAEPHPGLSADPLVLAAGFAAVALTPLVALALAAWRVAAPRLAASAAGVHAAARRPSVLGAALAGAGPATRAIGVRMAFDAGRGRTAVPVRTALAGTAAAVGALVAALVFGTSMIGLVSTPGRYGQNWDQKFDAGYADVPAAAGATLVGGIPGITGWAAGENGELAVNGQNGSTADVPAIAVDPLGGGTGYLTALDGRLPSAPGEIALGAQTLRALHRSVGQTVQVTGTWTGGVAGPPGTRTMRITGTVVLPAFDQPSLAGTDLGTGAVVTTPLLSGITLPECDGTITCYNFFLFRYRDGTIPATAGATMLARAAKEGCPPGQCTVTADQRPGDITDYAGIRDTPLILAVVLALLAGGTLTHVLLTGVRRRRRDLAVLKALGFTRSQLRAVVAWQASALAAGALVIGVPAGIVAGRWTWAVFANAAGVAPQATVALPAVLFAVPAVTLVLANLIAVFPGRVAARLRPASVLRTE